MAFLKIFKPKWENPDPEVRLKAIRKLDDKEQDLFAQILFQDQDNRVKQEALGRLSDLQMLEVVSLKVDDASFRKDICRKISSIYTKRILGDLDPKEKEVCLNKVLDENILAQIAIEAPEVKIRLKAIEKISDQSLLLNVLTDHCGKEPGFAALHKISDINLLEEAAEKASSRTVRASARDKLIQLRGPDLKELQKIKDIECLKLLQEAEKLRSLPDPEEAHKRFTHVLKKWQQLDVESNTPSAFQFQKHMGIITNRLENFNKHRESERQRKEQYAQHFANLTSIFNELSELTDISKVHFPESLNDIINKWDEEIEKCNEPHFLPEDFLSEYRCLKKANQKKAKKIIVERDLLAQITSNLDTISTSLADESYEEVPSLLSECHKLHSPDNFTYLAVEDVFAKLSQVQYLFDEHTKQKEEEKNKLIQDTLAQRQALIDEVVDLSKAEDITHAEKRVGEIQKTWPTACDITTNFQEINEKFLEALKTFKEARETFYQQKDWQLWANKNLKEKIVVEMKSLHKRQDMHTVFKEMKRLQERWNKIGPVPAKEEGILWKQYTKASDHNFKRCQKFFKELDALASINTEKKRHLIKQAQEHAESKEWNKSTEALKTLQEQWKLIGRLKKEQEEELYSQFRKECDFFFTRRDEHYKNLAEQRQINLELKEKLCLVVEEMLQEPDTEFAKRVKEIQEEWKKIGPVPKKHDEKIWTRFRHACNKYYEWLDTLQPENLLQKEALCDKAEDIANSLDPQFTNVEKISKELIAIQKAWKSIGPAPKPQNNEIWKKFRNICDTFFIKKKKYYDEIDRQRPINEEKKREYINQVLCLIKLDEKKSVKTIIRLQEEWKSIGPATRKNDTTLNKQFKEGCDTFFTARRRNFEELDRIRRENLRKKEELCVRLELIAGIVHEQTPKNQKNSILTLADQLKLAFESNFALSGDEKSSQRRKSEEIVQIQKDWNSIIGELPREHENAIQKRYNKALSASQAQSMPKSKK